MLNTGVLGRAAVVIAVALSLLAAPRAEAQGRQFDGDTYASDIIRRMESVFTQRWNNGALFATSVYEFRLFQARFRGMDQARLDRTADRMILDIERRAEILLVQLTRLEANSVRVLQRFEGTGPAVLRIVDRGTNIRERTAESLRSAVNRINAAAGRPTEF